MLAKILSPRGVIHTHTHTHTHTHIPMTIIIVPAHTHKIIILKLNDALTYTNLSQC